MKPELRITVLIENTVFRPGLLAEHGLSLWIEYENLRILFDTGQSDSLVHNAQTLGLVLATINGCIEGVSVRPDLASIAWPTEGQ